MFNRRSRPTVDPDKLKSQASDVGAVLSDTAARAGLAAGVLAHQAKESASHARDWAAPRVEKAWYEGKKAAAPKVERAAERTLPVVDRTHDRLVDDVLPRLLAAVNAAAAATAVGADKARDVATDKLSDLAHIKPEPPKKSHKGAAIFWSIAGLAVVGAVLAAVRRGRPTTDPWAEEPWEEAEHDLRARAAEAREGLGDAADALGETAGHAVAATREATEKAASKARSARSKADATDTEALPVAEGSEQETTPKRSGSRRSGGSRTTTTDGIAAQGPTTTDDAPENTSS